MLKSKMYKKTTLMRINHYYEVHEMQQLLPTSKSRTLGRFRKIRASSDMGGECGDFGNYG